MSRKTSCILVLLFLLLSVAVVVAPTPTPGPSGGGGGGGSSTSIDKIFKALQDAKTQKNPKFDELKDLLYIEPFNTKKYDTHILLGLGVTGNKTLTRKDEFVLSATVVNPNPIEIRRVLYLDLDVLEPGEVTFRTVNSVPAIVMNNDYNVINGMNKSFTSFPELTSFEKLKAVGLVTLRLHATDGKNIWTSTNLTINVINRPPSLENLTLNAPSSPRFNDPITYLANVTDLDGDLINVTLHVLNEKGIELRNETQMALPGTTVSFVANQYGFFDKADSGRNFTYYYTFGDGIVVNNTTILMGPHLKKSTSVWVGTPVVVPEDENLYWWGKYNFSLDMKNLESGEADVTVNLFTNTEAHPWKASESRVVKLTQQPQVVYFNVKPFDILDANKTFDFRFKYSETDQHQQDHIDKTWSKAISAKLMKYEFISGLGLGNVLAVLLTALLISILVERRFYK